MNYKAENKEGRDGKRERGEKQQKPALGWEYQ